MSDLHIAYSAAEEARSVLSEAAMEMGDSHDRDLVETLIEYIDRIMDGHWNYRMKEAGE